MVRLFYLRKTKTSGCTPLAVLELGQQAEQLDIEPDERLELLSSSGGRITTDSLYPLMVKIASEEDRADPEGLREGVSYIAEVLTGHLAQAARTYREGRD